MSGKVYLKAPYSIVWPENSQAASSKVLEHLSSLLQGSPLVRRRDWPRWFPGQRRRMKRMIDEEEGKVKANQGKRRRLGQKFGFQSGEAFPLGKTTEEELLQQEKETVESVVSEYPEISDAVKGDSRGVGQVPEPDPSKSYQREVIHVGMNNVLRRVEKGDGDVSLVLVDTDFLNCSAVGLYLGFVGENCEKTRMCKVEKLSVRVAKILNLNKVAVLGVTSSETAPKEFKNFLERTKCLKHGYVLRRKMKEEEESSQIVAESALNLVKTENYEVLTEKDGEQKNPEREALSGSVSSEHCLSKKKKKRNKKRKLKDFHPAEIVTLPQVKKKRKK